MGFFEIPPRDVAEDLAEVDEEELVEARWLGGAVPLEELIAVSAEAAIGVRGVVAYRDGFRIEVVAWVRRPQRRRGYRMPGSHIQLHTHRFGLWQDDGSVSPDFVRFGIQFADGGRATNVDDALGWPDATEPMHGLDSRGGSSSDSEASQEFWAWPLPETGDLDLVCEWPAYGIPESRLTVSGDSLRAAAARARLIWPDDEAPGGSESGRSVRAAGPFGSRSRMRSAGMRRNPHFRTAAAGPAPGGAAGMSPGGAGSGRDGAAGSAPGGGAGSAPGGQTTAAGQDHRPGQEPGPEQDRGPEPQ
jgi:hypothetical protein